MKILFAIEKNRFKKSFQNSLLIAERLKVRKLFITAPDFPFRMTLSRGPQFFLFCLRCHRNTLTTVRCANTLASLINTCKLDFYSKQSTQLCCV